MREIQASEAKTHLPKLLDQVEQGETLVITRHGRPVARLVPNEEQRRAEIGKAIDEIQKLRENSGSVTVDELLAFRHEGHER